MNDSFSGKNGKVKVMYVRSDDDNGDDRNKNKRPAGKGRPADGARSGRTGQDKARGGNDRRGADSAAVKAIVLAVRRALKIAVATSRRGEPSRARRMKSRRSITAVSAAKALSIRSSCAASARKKPAFTVKTPVRRCSPAVRKRSCAHGSCSRSPRVSAKRCAGWRLTARLTTWWMRKSWPRLPAPSTTAASAS